jgi:glycerophosphoryl diester phosphodiesterase
VIELLRGNGPLLRIGHRGAAALATENTLRSLEVAIDHGVDLVEFDIARLRDGTLVLAHSRREAGARPATLDETLALLAANGVGAHLDLKCSGSEPAVVEALRRHGVLERTIVSSFSARTLRVLHALEPALRLGFTYPRDLSGLGRHRVLAPAAAGVSAALRSTLPARILGLLRRAGASAAVLHHRVVSPAVVDRCHAHGAAVLVWTVNDPELARRLDDFGVDAVITDDPRIFGG